MPVVQIAYGTVYFAPASYQGMDKAVENSDVWNILLASDKMSDQMAYDIVKTLMEKKAELVAVHKEAQNIDLKYQKIGSPLPYQSFRVSPNPRWRTRPAQTTVCKILN